MVLASGFNEAPAKGGGESEGLTHGHRGSAASMRPPQKAAGNFRPPLTLPDVEMLQ